MSVVSIGFVGQQDTSHHNTSGTHASSAMSGRSATGWSPGIGTGTPGRSSTERHAERHHGSHAVGRILVVVATPSLLSDRIMPWRAGRRRPSPAPSTPAAISHAATTAPAQSLYTPTSPLNTSTSLILIINRLLVVHNTTISREMSPNVMSRICLSCRFPHSASRKYPARSSPALWPHDAGIPAIASYSGYRPCSERPLYVTARP